MMLVCGYVIQRVPGDCCDTCPFQCRPERASWVSALATDTAASSALRTPAFRPRRISA